ncbi:MAG: hypothetical protein DRQ51_06210 [Gammaproteobacteria bacterium]|nr:MAG: hypothetical protein DRQ51_06210 [Gammaproteobacteria bacterium]
MNIIKIIEKDKSLLGKVLIFNKDKLIKVVDSYNEAFAIANNKKNLHIFKAPKNILATRILPLRVKSFKKHPWTPLYPIAFFNSDNIITENCLVDSGADISAINYQFGLGIGLTCEPHDYIFQIEGMGGLCDYILKNIKIKIDDTALQIPVAWLQDKSSSDMIIGREVVFDEFNIEFKQKSETIIFNKV